MYAIRSYYVIVPLLHLFDHNDLEISFLDIHQSSLNSVKNIIEQLSLENFVKEYICDDATRYKTTGKIHIILSETMKASLERELV